jgi:hypothetical protein
MTEPTWQKRLRDLAKQGRLPDWSFTRRVTGEQMYRSLTPGQQRRLDQDHARTDAVFEAVQGLGGWVTRLGFSDDGLLELVAIDWRTVPDTRTYLERMRDWLELLALGHEQQAVHYAEAVQEREQWNQEMDRLLQADTEEPGP